MNHKKLLELIPEIESNRSAIELFRTIKQSNHNVLRYKVIKDDETDDVTPGIIYVNDTINTIRNHLYHIEMYINENIGTPSDVLDDKYDTYGLYHLDINFSGMNSKLLKFNNTPHQVIDMGGKELDMYLDSYEGNLTTIGRNIVDIDRMYTKTFTSANFNEIATKKLRKIRDKYSRYTSEEEAARKYEMEKKSYLQFIKKVYNDVHSFNFENMYKCVSELCAFTNV